MSKFLKLAQLNQDIELLENAGKIKAADILHKKFIREAQTTNYPDDSPTPKDSNQPQIANSQPRAYNALLNEINMNADNSVFNELYQEYINNKSKYPKDEQDYLSWGINRILKFRRSQGIPLPAGATIIETRAPGAAAAKPTATGPQNYNTNAGVTVTRPGGTPAAATPATTPDATSVPASNAAPTVTPQGTLGVQQPTQFNYENTGQNYNPEGYIGPGFGANNIPNSQFGYENTGQNFNPEGYTGPSFTVNDVSGTNNPTPPPQAPEAQTAQTPTPPSPNAPNPPSFVKPAGPNTRSQERGENKLYSEAMGDIVALLENTYSFDQADKVYVDTIKFFRNPKRWDRFYAQYNKLRYDKYNEWLRNNK